MGPSLFLLRNWKKDSRASDTVPSVPGLGEQSCWSWTCAVGGSDTITVLAMKDPDPIIVIQGISSSISRPIWGLRR